MSTMYEIAARAAKATALARALTEAKIDSAKARAMDTGAWAVTALLAGVRAPSAETQAAVLELLEQQEGPTAARRGV